MDEFEATVAERLGLRREAIFGTGLTLAEVLARSPSARNSIDLLEAFAAAVAEHDLEDRLDLPAFTLDTSIDEVIAAIRSQLLSRAGATRQERGA